jgi:hypothetical protein
MAERVMKVLFVSYGGGHIEMCLPVMQALRQIAPDCTLRLMALTTAFDVAQAAGEQPFGYRDLCDHPDLARAREYGERLLAEPLHSAISREESLAYLGFNFLEWVAADGEAAAWQHWEAGGRHAFLPFQFFRQLLLQEQPDVVVATNSPRSEQAALQAAASLGIPTLSMIDLFALPGDPYLARQVHASKIAVLADATRVNLIAAGVQADRIVVTGNPAFDALKSPASFDDGRAWRQALGWRDQHVVFWAGHLEPDDAEPIYRREARLGQDVQDKLVQWVESRSDVCLAVRYHPNEWQRFVPPRQHPRVHWSQPDKENLLPVLMASDQVVVQATTVGLQAAVVGKRVISLSFSPLVQRTGMDYAKFGMAIGAGTPEDLVKILEQGIPTGGAPTRQPEAAQGASAAQTVALLIQNLGREVA